MGALIEQILENAGTGANTVFLGLFLLILYMQRKDAKEHKDEYHLMSQEMFQVVNKNTEANTKLSETISDLKDRVQ